jgi:hypothetical protein
MSSLRFDLCLIILAALMGLCGAVGLVIVIWGAL